jgi:F0F1-type ATP synthase assembly protein I
MSGKESNNSKAPWWQPSLLLFSKLSSWIIGPVILGIIVGKWLDKKFETEPWLFIITVGLAFLISMFGIVRDSMIEMKKIEEEQKNNQK